MRKSIRRWRNRKKRQDMMKDKIRGWGSERGRGRRKESGARGEKEKEDGEEE